MAERHSSARLLLCCLVELQRGVTLLAEGEADPESEFALSNPALVPYLKGGPSLPAVGDNNTLAALPWMDVYPV